MIPSAAPEARARLHGLAHDTEELARKRLQIYHLARRVKKTSRVRLASYFLR
jgi:hypothetical protein